MKQLLVLLFLVSVLNAGCTQDVAAQAPAARSLVITNARVIDGNGGVIERGSVVVRDGRIVSVSAGTATSPGAQVIDAKGMSVMPGFIDGHRHVIRGDATQWLNSEAKARMQDYLDAGFTTILSAGDSQDQILELRRRLQTGEITGPTLIVTGRAGLAGRAGGAAGRGGDPARFDVSRPPLRPTQPAPAIAHEQTRAAVQALAKAGADAIKTGRSRLADPRRTR